MGVIPFPLPATRTGDLMTTMTWFAGSVPAVPGASRAPALRPGKGPSRAGSCRPAAASGTEAGPRRRLLAPHRKRRLGSLLATESQPASGPGSCVRAASPPPPPPPPGPAVVTSHPAASRCVLWAALPVAPRSGAQRSRSRGKPAGCSPDSAPTPAPPRVRAAGAPWPRASLAELRPEAQGFRPRGASPTPNVTRNI
ncbi:basic proline-rich protein-like isoform X2 [Vulpes lagopus]|uniref:basic proline-rich protein-like isoform X2 n=1 Tax=Vulpes lagopus TaxID=494514 RepID=UPI001BC9EC17|nr:basic proline-rich protein-like isoform X2 [Vulpes lagopus]XP_041600842.1 basic proline-rich protein-like isoform X2 [Vulpes lagopus]